MYVKGMSPDAIVIVRKDLNDYINDLAKAYDNARKCWLVLCSYEKTVNDFVAALQQKDYVDHYVIDLVDGKKHLIVYIGGGQGIDVFTQAVRTYATTAGILTYLTQHTGYEYLTWILARGWTIFDRVKNPYPVKAFYQRHYFIVPKSEAKDLNIVPILNNLISIIISIIQGKPISYNLPSNVSTRIIEDLNVHLHLFTTIKYSDEFLDALTNVLKELANNTTYLTRYAEAAPKDDLISQVVRSVASNEVYVYYAILHSGQLYTPPTRLYPASDSGIKSRVEDALQGTIGSDIEGEGVEYYVLSDQSTISKIEDIIKKDYKDEIKTDNGRKEAVHESAYKLGADYSFLETGSAVLFFVRSTAFDIKVEEKIRSAFNSSSLEKTFDKVMASIAKAVERGYNVEGLYINKNGQIDRISAYEFNISWAPVYITGTAAVVSTILILILGR